jgi:carboxyl-terminal processing protease
VRLNPGGYLESARDIVDDLLPGEKMVVYTKGRNSSLREYKTRDKDLFERGKVAILIDERSASASEILAGAVQDWDRGIIVGRRSYGKGLVQEQYDMDDGAALRLTIAKYYTPSGRSIQRPYAKGRDAYEEDFSHRYETGELVGIDTVMHMAAAASNPMYMYLTILQGLHPVLPICFTAKMCAMWYGITS